MAGASTWAEMKRDTLIGPPVWAPPVAGAMLYPLLVKGFIFLVAAEKLAGDLAGQVALSAGALCVMGLELAVPGVALWALLKMRTSVEPNAPLVRRVLHVVFATPPLVTLSGFATGALGIPLNWVWYGGWILVSTVVLFARPESRGVTDSRRYLLWLRSIHGVCALLLLLGFLSLHLGSHVTALWTVQLQHDTMTFLRIWYRSDWVQPIILVLFGMMIFSGILMAVRYTATTADKFRTLQTASGAYLVAFIGSHSLAVFGARAQNVETDWQFAAGGPLGLLHEAWRGALIDYYTLSVFLIVVHAVLGLRIVALSHGTQESTANRVVIAGIAGGAVLTGLIMAAALGMHVGT